MPTTTSMQGLPLPVPTDDPNVPDDMSTLALAIEKKLVGVYASVSDRNSKVTTPVKGQVAFLQDTTKFTYWNSSAWVDMVPSQVSITSGSTVPANSVGNNGDLFLKTS